MATDIDPIVGNWYQHLDKGQKFEVIAVDEDERVVEIQYFDGNVEALDLDEWYALEIEPAEAPEDWTGPLNNVERDDLGYSETNMESEDWSAPLRELSRGAEDRESEEEEEDVLGEGRPEEEPREEED